MTGDEQSIHQIVEQLETAWNASDSAGVFCSLKCDRKGIGFAI